MSKSSELFTVNKLPIRDNCIYKVTNKVDRSAPDGFIREGTTKVPSSHIGNSVSCRYVVNPQTGKGLWDTGFYEGSPCYANMDKREVSERVKLLREKIVEPYQSKFGDSLDHTNNGFWDNYSVLLHTGKVFNTEEVEDLLGIYIATLGFELTPKSELGNPAFKISQYCIEDKEAVRESKVERDDSTVNAISEFGALKNTNNKRLVDVLTYVGLKSLTTQTDDKTLNSTFLTWLSLDFQNAETFSKAVKLANNPKTTNQVALYAILDRLAVKGAITRMSGDYYYQDTFIGSDLKSAAENLNKNKELAAIKVALIEQS